MQPHTGVSVYIEDHLDFIDCYVLFFLVGVFIVIEGTKFFYLCYSTVLSFFN